MHDHDDATAKDYGIFAAIILLILLGAAIFQQTRPVPSLLDGMRGFEGLFFVTFACFKLADLKGFVDSYESYDVIAKRWRSYGYVYPFIELALGLGFLSGLALRPVLFITLGLMAVGSVGVLRELLRGSQIRCACLGSFVNLPLTQVSLTEDMVMGVMAAVMLAQLGL